MQPTGSFRHATPELRVYYGGNCLNQLGGELQRAGCRRPIIFCGQSIARARGCIDLIMAATGDSCAGVFDGVQAHSPLPAVLAGRDALRHTQADAVIAVGGGSTVVSARAASILLGEDKSLHELCSRFEPGRPPVSPRLLQPKLPQFVIPTTPTTAYAKAGTAVVDPAQRKRLTMFDPQTRPRALFFHPELALSAPSEIARDAALNAFVMAVQGLESNTREPLADALLLHALRLFRDNLPRLETDPGSAEVRGQMMLAALLAGQGTDYTSGGLASVIGHCIGARFHLPNGLTNAILLPHTIRFNGPATTDRLAVAAEILGAAEPLSPDATADAASRACAAFFASLALPSRLRDIGVNTHAFQQLADDAAADWFLYQNPRPVAGAAELIAIMEAAW
jgi:alcohol dehydrogenase class IV